MATSLLQGLWIMRWNPDTGKGDRRKGLRQFEWETAALLCLFWFSAPGDRDAVWGAINFKHFLAINMHLYV
jgi:hypothetical protein